jgi:hypothetical protein
LGDLSATFGWADFLAMYILYYSGKPKTPRKRFRQ